MNYAVNPPHSRNNVRIIYRIKMSPSTADSRSNVSNLRIPYDHDVCHHLLINQDYTRFKQFRAKLF